MCLSRAHQKETPNKRRPLTAPASPVSPWLTTTDVLSLVCTGLASSRRKLGWPLLHLSACGLGIRDRSPPTPAHRGWIIPSLPGCHRRQQPCDLCDDRGGNDVSCCRDEDDPTKFDCNLCLLVVLYVSRGSLARVLLQLKGFGISITIIVIGLPEVPSSSNSVLCKVYF